MNDAAENKKYFTGEAENARYTYCYDPGKISGPPEDCYPSSFDIEDYIDGGIVYKYNGEMCAWGVFCEVDGSETDEMYTYGEEGSYDGEVESIVDILNNVFAAIDERGWFDENDDEGLFMEAENWNDVLLGEEFPIMDAEIYPCMPDFEKVAGARR